jgi:pimeloyl-ACP methyl ester carboxylesterase
VLVHLKDDDYVRPISVVSAELFNEMISNIPKLGKIIIVAHSFGAFYALSMAKLYPQRIHALLLLDPTAKTESYRNYLINDGSTVQIAKLKNFDDLPDPIPLNSKIIVKVYLNIDLSERNDSLNDKLSYFNKFTKVNINSDIIVSPNRSHMLHYDMPDKFIAVVRQLIKIT